MGDIEKLFNLQGKVAIITGGAGMLGLQYAEVLSEAGAHIVIADINPQAAKEKAAYITRRSGVNALGAGTDISRKASVERMTQRVLKEFGRIDILVNNAALTLRGGAEGLGNYFAPFEEYPLELWEKTLAVNITGMFLCCQSVGNQMLKQGGGVIVNISSQYGVVAPDQRLYADSKNPYDASQKLNSPIPYSVSKGAVLALTRYLAAYWAGKNIRVNSITPGGVYESHDENFLRNYAYRAPLGRMARKEELKGAILFLASDASSYMTGANIIVDGGWTVW